MKEQFKGIVKVESFDIIVEPKKIPQKRVVEVVDSETNIRRPAYEITTIEVKKLERSSFDENK